MSRQRSILAGFTDYTGVSLDDVITHIRDWRNMTKNAITDLERHRKSVLKSAPSGYPRDQVISYVDYFLDLFRRYSGDFELLVSELENGVRNRHIEVIRQIVTSAGQNEEVAKNFKRDMYSYDDVIPRHLLDDIYVDSREPLVDYWDLDNARHRLEAFVDNSSPSQPAVPKWFAVVGAVCGVITLLFLMALVGAELMSIEISDTARRILVLTFALGCGLSSSFLGGDALVRGALHIPIMKSKPFYMVATGGIAVTALALVLSQWILLQ